MPNLKNDRIANRPPILAVIFDLYGTLISLEIDTKPFLTLAKRLPLKDRRDAIQYALTTPRLTLSGFVARFSIKSLDTAILEQSLADDLDHARLFDDAVEVLDLLRHSGIRLALLSNLATPYKQPVEALNLDCFFDALVYSCDCEMQKPDSAIYRHAL